MGVSTRCAAALLFRAFMLFLLDLTITRGIRSRTVPVSGIYQMVSARRSREMMLHAGGGLKPWTAVLFGLIALSGCASIVDGSSQSLSVKTMANVDDVTGAQCTLTNSKGVWYVTTPGTITVHRAYGDMNVSCLKQGYVANIRTVASSTRGMAFGNILFGGLIGAGVDISTGAAYDYPSPIIVPLQPVPAAGLERGPTS
jgi:hypothetical protein